MLFFKTYYLSLKKNQVSYKSIILNIIIDNMLKIQFSIIGINDIFIILNKKTVVLHY